MPIVHLKNSSGVITEYTVTPPQTLTGIPAGTYTFTEGLTERSVTVTASGGTPTPTPAPTLNALTLSPNTGTVGTAYTGTVSGKTASSSLALSGTGAAGLSISGTTVSGTPTTAGSVNIIETLAGATGSPRTSSGVLTVAASGTPTTFTDNFDYANGSSLDGVNGWSVPTGTWNIQDSSAYGSVNPSTAIAPFVPANANHEVEVAFRLLTLETAANSFFTLNLQGTDTFFFLGHIGSPTSTGGKWRIGARVNGVNTTLNEVTANAVAGTIYTLRGTISVSGGTATLNLYVNGSLVATGTSTDPALLAAGRVGLWQNGAAATATTVGRFNSFTARNIT